MHLVEVSSSVCSLEGCWSGEHSCRRRQYSQAEWPKPVDGTDKRTVKGGPRIKGPVEAIVRDCATGVHSAQCGGRLRDGTRGDWALGRTGTEFGKATWARAPVRIERGQL